MNALIKAINDLTALVEQQHKEPPIEALIELLDRIVGFHHTLEKNPEPTDCESAPPYPSHEITAKIRHRFSNFNNDDVPTSSPENIRQTQLMVGDPVEDLADIIIDLQEVLWHAQNTTENDALFHFQLGYRSHWGRHLRSLQLFLHDTYW